MDDLDKLTFINNECEDVIDFNGLLPFLPVGLSVTLLPVWCVNRYSCHLWGTHLMDNAGLMDDAIFLFFCYMIDKSDFSPFQIQYLLNEPGVHIYLYIVSPPILWCDNSGVTCLSANAVFHILHKTCSKWFLLCLRYGRQQISYYSIIDRGDQLVDIFTVPLSPSRFALLWTGPHNSECKLQLKAIVIRSQLKCDFFNLPPPTFVPSTWRRVSIHQVNMLNKYVLNSSQT